MKELAYPCSCGGIKIWDSYAQSYWCAKCKTWMNPF